MKPEMWMKSLGGRSDRTPLFKRAIFAIVCTLAVMTFSARVVAQAETCSPECANSKDHKILGGIRQVLSHKNTASYVESIAWNPDGQRLASTAQMDRELVLWDVTTGNAVKRISLGKDWRDGWEPLAFLDDGRTLVADWIGYVADPKFRPPTEGQDTGGDQIFDTIAFPAPDTPYALTLLDGRTGEVIENRPEAAGVVGSQLHLVATSQNGNLVALLFNRPDAQSLLLEERHAQKTISIFGPSEAPHHDYAHAMSLSPDGRFLAMIKAIYHPVGNKPRLWSIILWDMVEKREVKTIPISQEFDQSPLWAVKWSPDGKSVAVVVELESDKLPPDGEMRVVDISTGKTLRVFHPTGKTVNIFQVPKNDGPSRKGTFKGSAPVNPEKSASREGEKLIFLEGGKLQGIDWSPDGGAIAVCTDRLRILDASSMAILDQIPNVKCNVVAFSPDGSLLAYGSHNSVIIRKIITSTK